ncbi:MAG TPA: transposase [Thermodesulfobacteriota bacterium]|nr:transposase [Thermodesulfobacteriota bacterium]
MSTLFDVWHTTQTRVFPWLEEQLDPLSEKEKEFVQVVSLIDLPKHMRAYRWFGIGRKRVDRTAIVKAFVAKAIYNIETTKALIEYLRGSRNLRRLCGWESRIDIPSESTFSRAFAEYARGCLPQKIHEAMVKAQCGEKLAGHVSYDATAIVAREKAVRVQADEGVVQPKKKRGRPKQGEEKILQAPKRLDLQGERSLEDNLLDLPYHCAVGTKKDSRGYKMTWRGYKLHICCIDGDVPVSALLTSASLHDSQAAIPLMQMTKERVTSLYDLMDAAYDAPQIKAFSEKLSHVPIIDPNPRRGEKIPLEPARKARFAQRSSVERVNSYLKDNHGGSHVRVRGSSKVMAHLMFGLIVITANQLFGLLC